MSINQFNKQNLSEVRKDKNYERIEIWGVANLGEKFDISKTYHDLAGLGDIKFVGYRKNARRFPYIVQQVSTGKRICIPQNRAERIVKMTA